MCFTSWMLLLCSWSRNQSRRTTTYRHVPCGHLRENHQIAAVVERLEQRTLLSTLYDFDVIVRTGDQGLTGLGSGPSINDNGTVAFVGRFEDGSDSLFVGNGLSAPKEVSVTLRNPSRTFRESVQINNGNAIAAVDRFSGLPASFYLRIWNADTGNYQLVAQAGPGTEFDSFFDSEGISNDYRIASVGKSAGLETVILNRGTELLASMPSPQQFLRPMIDRKSVV